MFQISLEPTFAFLYNCFVLLSFIYSSCLSEVCVLTCVYSYDFFYSSQLDMNGLPRKEINMTHETRLSKCLTTIMTINGPARNYNVAGELITFHVHLRQRL